MMLAHANIVIPCIHRAENTLIRWAATWVRFRKKKVRKGIPNIIAKAGTDAMGQVRLITVRANMAMTYRPVQESVVGPAGIDVFELTASGAAVLSVVPFHQIAKVRKK